MLRNRKLAIVSHCILNQNTVVHYLARAKGAFSHVISELIKNDFGLYQLPCPEFLYHDLKRPQKTFEEYKNTPGYQCFCQKIADKVFSDVKKMADDNVEIKIIWGIEKSPTCAVLNQTGHLYQALLPLINQLFPNVELKEIPHTYKP